MIRFRLTAGLIFGVLAVGSVAAHELKVFASLNAVEKSGEKATVFLSWGHRMPVDELLDGSGVERYEFIGPDGTKQTLATEGTSLHAHSLRLKGEGVHTIAACRKPAINTYIIDESGQRVFQRGPKSAHAGAKIDSAQRSIQTGQTLIVVGPASATAPKPSGLPFEIVPVDGPAAWKAEKSIRVKVLQNGKAAPNATVQARWVGFKPDEEWVATGKSDESGEWSFLPKQGGIWVVKAQLKTPAAEAVKAEYDVESFTTTLSFEISR